VNDILLSFAYIVWLMLSVKRHIIERLLVDEIDYTGNKVTGHRPSIDSFWHTRLMSSDIVELSPARFFSLCFYCFNVLVVCSIYFFLSREEYFGHLF